jgi:hypothetical protein
MISPDARYIARTYSRDCGATTLFNTQVQIADASPGTSVMYTTAFRYNDRPGTLRLEWVANDVLMVEVNSASEPRLQIDQWHEVKLQYVRKDGSTGFAY